MDRALSRRLAGRDRRVPRRGPVRGGARRGHRADGDARAGAADPHRYAAGARRGSAHTRARRLGRCGERLAPRRRPTRAVGWAVRRVTAGGPGGRAPRWTAGLDGRSDLRAGGAGGRHGRGSAGGGAGMGAPAGSAGPRRRRRGAARAPDPQLSGERVRARSSARAGAGARSDPEIMKRREFVRVTSAGVMSAFVPSFHRSVVPSLFVPMDDSQSDHLKAYGLAYRVIGAGLKVEWLLNYQGGAFLLPDADSIRRDAALSGVRADPV